MRRGGLRRGKSVTLLWLVALAVATAGCSSVKSMFGSSDTSQASAAGTTGASTPGLDDIECPGIEVRTGASTLLIGSKAMAGDPAATDLRYQGTLVRTAR